MIAERILSISSDSQLLTEPDRWGQDPRVRAFCVFMLMHTTARMWMWGGSPGWGWIFALTMTVCLMLVVFRKGVRVALLVAVGVHVVKLLLTFPRTSNHFFIEMMSLVLLASFNLRNKDDQLLWLQTMRWSAAIILFYTGAQKVLHGTYFDGQFLGFSIARGGKFANLFGWFLPAEEFSRLTDFSPINKGDGPFSVQSVPFVLMSNLVYVFEMVTPIFLLWKRTRVVAVCAALLFTIGIQAGALELMLGALFVNLLLLFFDRPYNRWTLPFFALLYLYLGGVDAGILPEHYFN